MKFSDMLGRMRSLAVMGAAAGVLAVGAIGCGDDEPTAPPPPAGNSPVIVMHANTDNTASEVVFRADTFQIARLGYGAFATQEIRNATTAIKVFTTSGTQVGTANVTLDTTKSTFAAYVGTAASPEAFAVSNPKLAPSGGNAAVRVVNASRNAGRVGLRVNELSGLAFTADSVAYKSGTAYVSLPVSSTEQLIVTRANGDSLLTIPVKQELDAGKRHTIVIYGSADPQATGDVRLTAKVIQEDK